MKKRITGVSAAIAISLAAVYGGDYVFWRYRIVTDRHPFGTVTVQFYYAIQQKNGKTEYDFQPPQQETCVNSLFPRGGYSPCWYERRQKERAIRI